VSSSPFDNKAIIPTQRSFNDDTDIEVAEISVREG
jgi:hypothetical protein